MKCPRVQVLTIELLLSDTERATHPDYVPTMIFKKSQEGKAGRCSMVA